MSLSVRDEGLNLQITPGRHCSCPAESVAIALGKGHYSFTNRISGNDFAQNRNIHLRVYTSFLPECVSKWSPRGTVICARSLDAMRRLPDGKGNAVKCQWRTSVPGPPQRRFEKWFQGDDGIQWFRATMVQVRAHDPPGGTACLAQRHCRLAGDHAKSG